MAIWTAPKKGDPAWLFAAGQSYVQQIVSDGESIFWTRGFSAASTWEGGVAAKPIPAGSSVRTLATGWYAEGIAIVGANVYFAARRPEGGRIMQVPKQGGDLVEVASGITPRALAAGGDFVYWSDTTAGTVNRTDIRSGSTQTISDVEGVVEYIALDEACVYWLTSRSLQTGRPAVRRSPR